MVTIAYWDTQQEGRPPRLLGEIQGTPTIRLFKPKRKQSNPKSNSQKTVVDYRYERKAKDMLNWIEENMTNYVETVKFGMDDFKKIHAKASKFGLPMAIFFTTKPKTTALLKSLSTEYRRRMLIVQVTLPIAKNQPVLEEFGLTNGSSASLVVVPHTGDHVTYTDGDFSRRKLSSFLKIHATKDPVYEPIDQFSSEVKTSSSNGSSSHTTASSSSTDAPKAKVHTEL